MLLVQGLKCQGFGPFRDTVTPAACGVNTLSRNEAVIACCGPDNTIFRLLQEHDPGSLGIGVLRTGAVHPALKVSWLRQTVRHRSGRILKATNLPLRVDNGKQKNLVSGEHNPLATKKRWSTKNGLGIVRDHEEAL